MRLAVAARAIAHPPRLQGQQLADAGKQGQSENDVRDHDHEDEPQRERLRGVFVSDTHLGTPGRQAGALLEFLKQHPSDQLYLVPRDEARQRARDFSWATATQLFLTNLVPAGPREGVSSATVEAVTELSSGP